MNSLWEQTVRLPDFKSLDKDTETDVLIIGGGMCGLLCAYMLHEAGADYILTEAERLCGGITKNTTAKLTSQHGLIYDSLIKRYGVKKAGQYLYANEAALNKYRELCGKTDCDFEEKNAYVYSLDNRDKIKKEISALEKLGFKADFADSLPLPFPVAGAAVFPNQAQVNPLKFASETAKGLNIFEHTRVLELIGNKAVTNRGTVRAKKIIVATHFPFINKYGGYFIKMYQHRSYVMALENAIQVDGMYVDEAQKGMSFRNHGELLLIGGGGHRTGKKGGGLQELQDYAERYYPEAKVKYCWATQDCMSLDNIPYIGDYSSSDKGLKGLYVASGFNKWGMTSSMAAAMLLTDMITGKDNPYSSVFSPSRSILHPQLAVNILEATVGLLTPTTKRCPHLGCALKWNPYEHSWDCTCHGSRFTEDGRLIDNPATGDLKI